MSDFLDQYFSYVNTQVLKARLKRPRHSKRFATGWENLIAWSQDKTDCKHAETKVSYRDNLAVGDIVCWKEFCNRCHKLIDCGVGLYVQKDMTRKVTIDPATRYDGGYYLMLSKV